MNIQVETTGPCQKELRIEVPADRVSKVYREIETSYAEWAEIPGFRRGRAPLPLIRSRYRKELADEAQKRLLGEAFDEAIVQEKLTPIEILDAQIGEVKEGKPVSIRLLLEVAPEFELPNYTGIPITEKIPTITENVVDRMVDELRWEKATYIDANEKPIAEKDLVNIDFEGVCDGRPLEELGEEIKAFAKAGNFLVLVGDDPTLLPGISAALIGATAGERRQLWVDYPPEQFKPPLAGRKVSYFITVRSVRTAQLPEINDAFAQAHGYQTVEEMRRALRSQLEKSASRQARRQSLEAIEKYLLDNTRLDVPDSVAAAEARKEVYEMIRWASRRGFTPEEIRAQKDQIIRSASESAAQSVRLRFILLKIAKLEKINVEPGEIDEAIAMLATARKQTPKKLREEMERTNSISNVREALLIDKTMQWLYEHAQVTRVTTEPPEE